MPKYYVQPIYNLHSIVIHKVEVLSTGRNTTRCSLSGSDVTLSNRYLYDTKEQALEAFEDNLNEFEKRIADAVTQVYNTLT